MQAMKLAEKEATAKYSYGWQRAEVLGALINSVFLLALCFSIGMEAIARLISEAEVTNPKLIVIVGSAGLVSNIVGLFLFHDHGGHSHGGGGHSHGGHGHSHSGTADSEGDAARRMAKIAARRSNGQVHSNGERTPLLKPSSASLADSASSVPTELDSSSEERAEDELFVHPGELRGNIVRAAHDAGYGSHSHGGNHSKGTAGSELEHGHGHGSTGHGSRHAHDVGPEDEHGLDAEHSGQEGSMNMRGVFLHVLGDANLNMADYDSHHHQQRPRSVATGVSRKSSMASRNSQLIKKNTAPHPSSAVESRQYELRPSDILIERFNAWKRLVKNLIAYFEGIADIEANTAKELTKLGGVIQFLGEGGVQDIFYGVRERTRLIADAHANLAKTVEGSIVQHLQKLRTEIKAHVKNIQQDTGKLAASVAKERELSTKMITDLARSITMLKNTPMSVHAKEDPWFTNALVARQLQKQVHEENSLQKSIIIMQQNSEHFEEGVVRAIQMAWSTFDEWNARASASVQETWATMGQLMRSVAPTTEWTAFASRSEYLLDPDTPLRNPMTINYPGKDDPSVIPVHQGILERKKRYTKTYKESFYILTPAGYLHEFASSDISKHSVPDLSLFLPECTLGAPTNPNARSHKFHIEGKKAIGGDVGQKNGLFSMDASFTFRARSHDEMLEWWNDCKQLSKVYLTSSEPFDRSGPVPAAVRAAGYVTESEDEDEEDGSSVEEESEEEEEEEDEEETDEETDEEVGDHRHHAAAPATVGATKVEEQPSGEVPSYTAPGPDSGIQVGSDGYATEKKGPPALGPEAGNKDEAAESSAAAAGDEDAKGRFTEALEDTGKDSKA
ncbi:hypothetical protein OIO90_003405 [Microbotryomycetes sp. JL221]|nr:hypothetical protein OIO90_003405 [Microbotryomycetes sp. JL221]